MILSQYGRLEDELDWVDQLTLHGAYMRRKRWEAQIQANAIVKALSQAMSGGDGDGDGERSGPAPSQYRWISADAMFERIGGG